MAGLMAVGVAPLAATARGNAVALAMPSPSPSQFQLSFYDLGNPLGPGPNVITHR